jgi:hypothetical protein
LGTRGGAGNFPNLLYKIDPSTGIALNAAEVPPLNGFSFGFDFDPVVDRARVIAETNQNFLANPVGSSWIVLPDVFYAPADPNFGVDPNVVDIAYTNNFPGAAATQLFGIDTGLDVLVSINQATGALTTVGPLGVNVVAAGGFDVSGRTGTAYAALQPVGSSQSSLFTINLGTGAATAVGQIDGGIVISAMTVQIPEPTSSVLLVIGLVAGFAARRRRS